MRPEPSNFFDASDVWPIAVSGDGSTKGLSYPLSKHRCCGSSWSDVRPQSPPGSHPTRWRRGRWLRQPQCSMGRPSFHKQAPLAASLAASWVGSNQVPPNVPCPWPRLPPAIPSPRRPTLRTVPPRLPIFGARHPVPPTVERCDGLCCRPPVLSAIGSIGTRCASGK